MTRKTLALIAIAVVLGAYVFLVAPLEEKRGALRESLEMDHTTLMKLERFISTSKEAEPRLLEARKSLEEEEKYIIHMSDSSLAFAKVQAKIQNLASAARLSISTIKFLPAVQYNGYSGLPIYIECTGDIMKLSEFLHFLDSSREYIGLERIDVSTTSQNTLRIKMQLTGLMKKA